MNTQKLKLDLRRLRTMIDALETPMLIENEHRELICVNQAFCDMFGIYGKPDDLVGSDCAAAAAYAAGLFDEPDVFLNGIDQILAMRMPVQNEIFVMRDGRILERSYTPIYFDNMYQGHYWQYTDVTSHQITARELEASRDRAWEASRLKSEFLAMMSHEIRTPMNGVIGIAELLLTTNLDDLQRDYALMIYQESHALMRILNDILDFSKIEAGKVVIDPTPFSLEELCTRISEVIRYQAERKGLSFNLVLSPEIPMLFGDSVRLRQIIVNLLNNAIKFTKKGSVELRIQECNRVQRCDTGECKRVQLCIQVVDTGVGVAPENIEHLFEPFIQADSSTTRKHGGTGLGLAIVKRLVTMLEGNITVDSQVDCGTTFTVRLLMDEYTGLQKPVSPIDVNPVEIQPVLRKTPANNSAVAGAILVVEDNLSNRQLTMDYLHMLGYHNLEFAEDGQVAIDKVKSSPYPFALILMDIQLPHVDGMSATRIIREYEATLNRYTPIVALTAHVMVEDRRACLAAGMEEVLVKPVERKSLLNVLEKYIDGKVGV